MSLAIFGITNSGLNLVATLFVLMAVVLWLALIVYTYLDARRRISDPFLVSCATAAYAIVRPPEFLEDAHERELEIKAAELKVRQLREQTCPNCEYPVEKNYLRCPNCQRRLKDPSPPCNKPVDPRWGLCPYCETALAGGGERQRRPQKQARRPEPEPEQRRSRREAEPEEAVANRPPARRKKAAPASKKAAAKAARKEPARDASPEAPSPEPDQRSPSREPDPDPRQA